MSPSIITIAVTIILTVAWVVFRRRSTPPVELFGKIRSEILNLQRIASANILSLHQAQKLTGFDQNQMLRQSCHVAETIRYVYTIEESENGLIHTISSQMLKRKNEKYQVQCMLIAMLTLNQSLEAAGIDPKTVEFNIDRSVTGTHYLEMLLSQAQHDQMMSKNYVALSSGDERRR